MPVFSYLDLSASHLTENELEAIATNGSVRAIPHQYGAWVNVTADPEMLAEDISELRANDFPNLAACLSFAARAGCAWINFDQDADTEPGLPHFGW